MALVAAEILACGGGRGAAASAGDLRVTHAVSWGMPADGIASVGFRLENRGTRPDTLESATSAVATVMMHDVVALGNLRRMVPIDYIVVPPGARLMFGHGRQHLMLTNVDSNAFTRGAIPLELRFSAGERILLSVPVLRFTEAIEELERP